MRCLGFHDKWGPKKKKKFWLIRVLELTCLAALIAINITKTQTGFTNETLDRLAERVRGYLVGMKPSDKYAGQLPGYELC